jgi:hypothetical protein
MEGKVLSSNNVASEEIVAVLRSKFVDIFGYEFPVGFEAGLLIDCFLEVVVVGPK